MLTLAVIVLLFCLSSEDLMILCLFGVGLFLAYATLAQIFSF